MGKNKNEPWLPLVLKARFELNIIYLDDTFMTQVEKVQALFKYKMFSKTISMVRFPFLVDSY